MAKKYRALRIISGIYYFLAIVIFLAGTAGAIFSAVTPIPTVNLATGEIQQGTTNILPAIGIEVGVILATLGLLAVAQIIRLFLDLEENTRAGARYQAEQIKLMKMMVRQGQVGQALPTPRAAVAKQEVSDFPEFD